MTEVDLERVRVLARQLHTALGLDPDQMPTKKKPATDTRYEEAVLGGQSGYWQVDLDEDGEEVERRFLVTRNITRGMKSTED